MKRLQNIILQFFPPAQPLKAGIYHFQSPPDAPKSLRYHLRVEPDGTGLLIINAHTVLHLNQTAAEYAFHLIQQSSPDEVARSLSQRYRISKEQAKEDYLNLKERIETLIETPDLDPNTFLDIERENLYSAAVSAPYRLDCAVTYQLQDQTSHLAPEERVSQELSTDSWKVIIEKAWKAGISHVVFTGGEATLRPDLPELIAYAGRLGMVTGLLTDGLRLAQPVFLRTLLQSGLDHVMILLDHDQTVCWDAIHSAINEDISVCVHLTLTAELINQFDAIHQRLEMLKVRNISLSAVNASLKGELKTAQKRVAQYGIHLVWDFPVPYSSFNPVAFELAEGGEAVPQGAGKAWLYVEPDGDVLLSQGVENPLGNLLTDGWEQIWKNAIARAA